MLEGEKLVQMRVYFTNRNIGLGGLSAFWSVIPHFWRGILNSFMLLGGLTSSHKHLNAVSLLDLERMV